MQCLSENDLKTTSEVMVQTLKCIEPETSTKIKILIADTFCRYLVKPATFAISKCQQYFSSSPFVNAIASVLQPAVLTTLNIHDSQTRRYNNVVRTTLGPFSGRLDQLCYAVFKSNEVFVQRSERQATGLLDLARSHHHQSLYSSMVSLHPSVQVTEQVQVTILEGGSSWIIRCVI